MRDAQASPTPASETRFAQIEIRGRRVELEYAWVLPENPGPLLVFLHEGLGSLKMWRGFPRSLCAAAGARGLVYSRAAYGESSPFWPDDHWPLDFMHVEARELLPGLLAALGVDPATEPPILLGHSDGASIALIHAASFPGKVEAVIAMAPHIFVESIGLESIAETRRRFLDDDLGRRLGKYHQDVQRVFWGWANIWMHPEFPSWEIRSLLRHIRCPLLLLQGYDDVYGTMAQIEGIAALTAATTVKLENCGHSPHVDQPQQVIEAVCRFLAPRREPKLRDRQ